MSEVRVTQVAVIVLAPFSEGSSSMVTTERFDSGEGTEWYVVGSIIDSGNELLSKVIKSVRATGRLTNASARVYGYDVEDGIDINDLENGTNSSTGAIAIDDTTGVWQSERYPVNVPNAVLSTVRLSGDDSGQLLRDQVHEIIYEQAVQGVRR